MHATVFQSTPPVQDREVSAPTGIDLDSALSLLREVVIACCVSFPSDEELRERLGSHCASLESCLVPGERGRWPTERDNLLMRLGCRPWSY